MGEMRKQKEYRSMWRAGPGDDVTLNPSRILFYRDGKVGILLGDRIIEFVAVEI